MGLATDTSFQPAGCYTTRTESLDLGRRQWAAEQIALDFLAALCPQEGQLLPGFHALGDDAEAQAVSKPDHGTDDVRIVRISYRYRG